METWRVADLNAYVDDCLEPDERLAFEAQMAQDPALARRAAAWRAQNSAIRAAFDAEGARAFSISAARHQNEVLVKGRRSATVGGRPSALDQNFVLMTNSADRKGPRAFGVESRANRAVLRAPRSHAARQRRILGHPRFERQAFVGLEAVVDIGMQIRGAPSLHHLTSR